MKFGLGDPGNVGMSSEIVSVKSITFILTGTSMKS